MIDSASVRQTFHLLLHIRVIGNETRSCGL
jgi:hypothetical protein